LLKTLFLNYSKKQIYKKPTRNPFFSLNSKTAHSIINIIILSWPAIHIHEKYCNKEKDYNSLILIIFISIGFVLPFLNLIILNSTMNSLDIKNIGFESKNIQNTYSNSLDKNFFIRQKEKILNVLNKIRDDDKETNNEDKFHDKFYKSESKQVIIKTKENIEKDFKIDIKDNDIKKPLLEKDTFFKNFKNNKTCFDNNITIKEKAKIMEFDYNNNNNLTDKIYNNIDLDKTDKIDGEKQNLEKSKKENQDGEINIKNNKLGKNSFFKSNLNFIKKITFEDVNQEYFNENIKKLRENENLNEILKEKYILILIFCEFQAIKLYIDYLIFLLISFVNILIFLNKGEIIQLNNIIIFSISLIIFLSWLIFSCNILINFDQIIFNNTNNNVIKFFFFAKYQIFSINYFKDIKIIDKGYERYSSLSNSDNTISVNSNKSNFNDELNFEKPKPINYRTYLTKLVISDEKFFNNDLIFSLYFKLLRAFFQKNEKFFIEQENFIDLQINFNNKETRKSYVLNNITKNNHMDNINGNGNGKLNNINFSNGNKDILSVINNISESSANSQKKIKKKISFSFKKFLNKIEDFEIRNFIEKKLRNDILANTTADENFIINNNISNIEFNVEFLFSEYTLELLAYFDIKIKDILESLDQVKNKYICKILSEKIKNESDYNCFYTYDNFLYYEIYDTNTDYLSNLKNFTEKYSYYIKENILNWNQSYLPFIVGIFKINFMNFEKILILYRHPCAFSIFKDFKYWINIALTDKNENVTVSTTKQNQIIDVKLIEVIDNISFHPNDYDEFYNILIRDLEFLNKLNYSPNYVFNLFFLNDFKKFLNDTASNIELSDNNLDLNNNLYNNSNRKSINNRISVKSLFKNVNSIYNINSNFNYKNPVNVNSNFDENMKNNNNIDLNIKEEDKSVDNHYHKNILNEILSKLDKSDLIREDIKKGNYTYKKLYGSETVCSLDRLNDYYNLHDKYTLKFYFSKILPFAKKDINDQDQNNLRKGKKFYLIFFVIKLIYDKIKYIFFIFQIIRYVKITIYMIIK